nr:zinc-binding dehydrogenase [Pedobacter sp. N36a]
MLVTSGNPKSQETLIDNRASPSQIVDYHSEDFAQLIVTKNQGNPFDVCVDLVGLEPSELCAQVIRVNGRHAKVTAFETPKARSNFFDRGATVYHISNYAYSLSDHLKWYGDQLSRIAEMLENKSITNPREENTTHGKKIVMNIY